MADIIRVFRIVEIVGERNLVRRQVERSLEGTKRPRPDLAIHARTVAEWPESALADDNGELIERISAIVFDDREQITAEARMETIKIMLRQTGRNFTELYDGKEGKDA